MQDAYVIGVPSLEQVLQLCLVGSFSICQNLA